jgi:N-acetylmuramoyl-L-alanine amidase CwlA
MSYEIKQTLLDKYNRPRTPLTPQGIVVHETAGHNDTDEANFNFFNGANRVASAHYFVDNDSISQFIPDNEQAWHACRNGNIRYIGMELCDIDDQAKFLEVWKRGVWLVATKCIQYGWDPHNQMQVMSHKMVTDRWHESTHQDPDAYFAKHGKTFANFIADVVAQIYAIKNPILGQVKVVADLLNIRAGAGTSFKDIGNAPKGKVFNYTACVNDWYQVILDDHSKGFVFGKKGQYLQVIKK